MTPTSAPPVATTARALQAPAVTALAGAGSVGLVAVADPNTVGIYPACPSLTMFGVLCPLCGGLRGVHALTEGDVVGMVASNALLPVLFLLVAWGWTAWVVRSVGRGDLLPPPRLGNRTWLGLGLVALAYGVARNLPGLEVLAP